MANLINVSNRLPVTLLKGKIGYIYKESSGGLVTGLSGLKELTKFLWIGWPGFEIITQDQAQIKQELKKIGYIPVFLTKKVASVFYDNYCNETLWPLLHNFIDRHKYKEK